MDWINYLRKYKRKFRLHTLLRMYQRKITFSDFDETLEKLDIIEIYPNDKPYPSCLVHGLTKNNRPIHIVFSINKSSKDVFIITVYEPSLNIWEKNFKNRRKK